MAVGMNGSTLYLKSQCFVDKETLKVHFWAKSVNTCMWEMCELMHTNGLGKTQSSSVVSLIILILTMATIEVFYTKVLTRGVWSHWRARRRFQRWQWVQWLVWCLFTRWCSKLSRGSQFYMYVANFKKCKKCRTSLLQRMLEMFEI